MRILRKFAALLILILCLPLVWSTLTVHTVRTAVLQPGFIQQTVAGTGLYGQVPALIAAQAGPELARAQIPVSQAEIEAFAAQVLTPPRLQNLVDPLVDALFDWLYGRSERPMLTVDLRELKDAFLTAMPGFLAAKWESLPLCTPEQVLALETRDGLPACRPPGEAGEALWAELNRALDPEPLRRAVPDRIDVGEMLLQSPEAADTLTEMNRGRDLFLLATAVAGWWWVLLLVGGVLLTLLNLDRWHTPLGWLGFLLLLSGLPLVVAGFAVPAVVAEAQMNMVNPTDPANPANPAAALALPIAMAVGERLSGALTTNGLWLAAAGAALVVAVVVAVLSRPRGSRGGRPLRDDPPQGGG